jgi:hypothetical protein
VCVCGCVCVGVCLCVCVCVRARSRTLSHDAHVVQALLGTVGKEAGAANVLSGAAAKREQLVAKQQALDAKKAALAKKTPAKTPGEVRGDADEAALLDDTEFRDLLVDVDADTIGTMRAVRGACSLTLDASHRSALEAHTTRRDEEGRAAALKRRRRARRAARV